jgi:undecaprenyl-diphosphatase
MYDIYVLIAAQIVLESFPISSSGHVRLLELLGFNSGIIDQVQDQIFQHFLHGPTLVIIALFFWRRWTPLIIRLGRSWRIVVRLVFLVALADSITGLWYCFFAMHDVSQFPIGIGFCITALVLASLRCCAPSQPQKFAVKHALILGLVQGLALLPGISRMAITYVVARWLRFSERAALELSCAIQWPLIAAAFVRSAVQIMMVPHAEPLYSIVIAGPTLLVIAMSSVVAWFCLRLTQHCIMHNVLWCFAYYMVIPFTAWIVLTFC